MVGLENAQRVFLQPNIAHLILVARVFTRHLRLWGAPVHAFWRKGSTPCEFSKRAIVSKGKRNFAATLETYRMLRELRDRSEGHGYQENLSDIVEEASKALLEKEDKTMLHEAVLVVAIVSNISDYEPLPTLHGVAYGMFQAPGEDYGKAKRSSEGMLVF